MCPTYLLAAVSSHPLLGDQYWYLGTGEWFATPGDAPVGVRAAATLAQRPSFELRLCARGLHQARIRERLPACRSRSAAERAFSFITITRALSSQLCRSIRARCSFAISMLVASSTADCSAAKLRLCQNTSADCAISLWRVSLCRFMYS